MTAAERAYDREKVCYEQNFEQARNLNLQMNQVPVLAMTITGGLWFGAGVTNDLPMEIRFALLLFAGLCNIALILAVLRIRDVFESYLEKIEAFNKEGFASSRPKKPKVPWLGSYSMISIYSTLMLIGAFFSFFGAFWKYWPFEFSKGYGVGALVVTFLILYLYLFGRYASSTGGGN
jgi:hypothetical protein